SLFLSTLPPFVHKLMNSRHYKPFAQGRKRLFLPRILLRCQGITVGIPFYTASDRYQILGCFCVPIVRALYRSLRAFLLRRLTIIELDQILLVLHYPCTSRNNTSHDDIFFESA